MTRIEDLQFYLTPSHPCSYLSGQQATTLFADPKRTLDIPIYDVLSTAGFRRSGEHVYRPHCESCQACIPIRLPVAQFEPNRNQQRVLKKNEDVTFKSVHVSEEHYTLYEKYINTRHRDGDMYPATRTQFNTFLFSKWSDTRCYEMRDSYQVLVGAAVVDHLPSGLSAVYTFFDPAQEKRSLGVYAVLKEIELTRTLNLSYLYLGYYIKQCAKMNYKVNYRPLEMLINNRWVALL
jgi:arginine-tRNA-protein transferase